MRVALVDIDGTIAVDNTIYDGTFELIEYINSIGGKAVYITNNSTKSRKDYIEKFKKWNQKPKKEETKETKSEEEKKEEKKAE